MIRLLRLFDEFPKKKKIKLFILKIRVCKIWRSSFIVHSVSRYTITMLQNNTPIFIHKVLSFPTLNTRN